MRTKLLNIFIATFICIGLTACNDASEKPSSTFSVIRDSTSQTSNNRSVEIEIPNRIDENQLREIGLSLKEKNPSFNRMFISVYLKNEVHRPWANINFTPELNVKISGTNLEDEKKLESIIGNFKLPEDAQLLGSGDDQHSRNIFYKKDGKYFREEIFISGIIKTQYFEKSNKSKTYFQDEDDNGLIIKEDGTLDLINTKDNRVIVTLLNHRVSK